MKVFFEQTKARVAEKQAQAEEALNAVISPRQARAQLKK